MGYFASPPYVLLALGSFTVVWARESDPPPQAIAEASYNDKVSFDMYNVPLMDTVLRCLK
jgi:hypothetical protein